MSEAWQSLVDTVLGAFTALLVFLHDAVAVVPFLEGAAWGWAIILLTLIVRVLLLPLAIKQTRSMRAMQKLQPQIKELQKKYKVDRSLMRKDPEQYRAKRQKLNEEMMALYQREGANPAASCLPLLAQAPIFIALFWTLIRAEELRGAEFYFFTAVGEGGLEQIVRGAGWPGWMLIVLMSGTMFWSQRQMMARNAAQMADSPMAQQQKILLYVMPVFLAVVSINFPMGVLLYWVTTNFWQVAQQAITLRAIQKDEEREATETDPSPSGPPAGPSKGATSGKQKPASGRGSDGSADAQKKSSGKKESGKKESGKKTSGKKTSGKKASGKKPSEPTPTSEATSASDSGTDKDSGGEDQSDGAPRDRRQDDLPGASNGRRPRGEGDPASGGDDAAAPRRSKKKDHLPRRGDRR